MSDEPVTGQARLGFGGLLRRLRDDAGLTQDELAEAAQVSQRAISDLERGINRTARKDTAVLLAGALGLDSQARDLFVSAARGRSPASQVLAALGGGTGPVAVASRTLPRDVAVFTGRQAELWSVDEAVGYGGRSRWSGFNSRDRRDGRDRQDHLRGARGAPVS